MRKVLNLFAGIGGNRQQWKDVQVTAIELDPQVVQIYSQLYPQDEIIVEEVISWIDNNQEELLKYDFIWASPPCITHTRLPQMKYYFHRRIQRLDQLYGLVDFLDECLNHPKFNPNKEIKWVVENVQVRKLFVPYTFKLHRHYFWANFFVPYKQFNLGEIIYDHLRTDWKKLCGYYNLNQELFEFIEDDLRKRQILRNMVHPEVGQYILEQVFKKRKSILDF